jgi:NLR family CARD domain-containing protein 3
LLAFHSIIISVELFEKNKMNSILIANGQYRVQSRFHARSIYTTARPIHKATAFHNASSRHRSQSLLPHNPTRIQAKYDDDEDYETDIEQGEEAFVEDDTQNQLEMSDDESNSAIAPPTLMSNISNKTTSITEPTKSSASYQDPQDRIGEVWKQGAVGIGILASMAVIVLGILRITKTQAPKLTKAFESQKLAREHQARLQDFIAQIRNQSSVDLSGKNLGDQGFAFIIDSLAFNDRALAVDFSKNGITHDGIKQLATVLQDNETLRTLILDTNAAGDEGAAVLAELLAAKPGNIKTLSLSGNSIGDAGAKALAEMLKVNTTLEELELNGNSIDYDGIGAIAEALAANTSLRVLGLSDNYVGGAGAGILAAALKRNTTLEEIHIKGNELGDEGVTALCDALRERPPGKQQQDGDDEGVGIQQLKENATKTLDIGNNGMSKEGAAAVANLVRACPGLKELNLYMNEIGDEGASSLASAIMSVSSSSGDGEGEEGGEGSGSSSSSFGLEILDVGANNIGPDGAKTLSTALQNATNLKSIEFGYNPIGPTGVAALADLLKHDQLSVETVKLGWCKIGGADGAKALSNLLMFNQSIKTLDIRGNALGNDGAIHMSRGFREHSNKNLKELDVAYNEIKDEGAVAWAQALKANPEGACDMKMPHNYIGEMGRVVLVEAQDMVYEMTGKQITIWF